MLSTADCKTSHRLKCLPALMVTTGLPHLDCVSLQSLVVAEGLLEEQWLSLRCLTTLN